ncbi:hypothetical protein ACLOJK_017517 [Asimina triloba]
MEAHPERKKRTKERSGKRALEIRAQVELPGSWEIQGPLFVYWLLNGPIAGFMPHELPITGSLEWSIVDCMPNLAFQEPAIAMVPNTMDNDAAAALLVSDRSTHP